MRRRLPAVFLAALLTFAVSGCGDDSDDSDEPDNDASTSQSDDSTTDDSADDTTESAEPSETDDTTDADSDDQGGDSSDDDGESDDGESDDGDDNGAIPDDLESGEPDDPDDLPISAQVVLDTCEDVDPKDTWPGPGSITFDGEGRSVVATADVKMKDGQTATVVCAIAGSENNPQVKAYNPI